MFTTIRMGIYTSQQGLNLTGNNIANINTVGYTRQTLDIQSMNAGGVDRYADSTTRIGSGAYVTGISQMRDPYLDIRYRTECASVGFMDTKLSNLNDLSAILDEVGKGDDGNGIISAQLSDLMATLENLSEYTGQGEFDTQVRSSASSLVALFNTYANKLDQVEINAVERFNQDVTAVNELLTNIQNLTTSIRKGDIHGSPSLEMRDERNRLIDELSQYIKLDVSYEMENISPGVDVEKLRIKLADHYTPPIYLVDGIYAVQLQHDETMPSINPDYDPEIAGSLPYLDKNGKPVASAAKAAQVKNTNFNLTLSRLKDTKGNIQTKYLSATSPEPVTSDAIVDGYSIDDKIAEMGNENRLTWSSQEAADGTITDYVLRQVTTSVDGKDVVSYEISKAVRRNSVEVHLGDNDLYGSLQASREFLTEDGEFSTEGYINLVDPSAASKRGIRYYKHALDLLANKLATSMNDANNGYLNSFDSATEKYYYVDGDGNFILDDNGDRIEKTTMENLQKTLSKTEIARLVKPKQAGNLFSTRGDWDDAEGITAANISISAAWSSGDVQIVNSYSTIPGTGEIASTDNTNILHMVTLMNKDITYIPNEIVPTAKEDAMFIGSFGEMLANMHAVLGNDQRSTQIMLDNYYEAAVELDTNRDSVSSVDLNDETVNMIQYQKSYSAACRLMTTMDEVLDKLINGTGTAGR